MIDGSEKPRVRDDGYLCRRSPYHIYGREIVDGYLHARHDVTLCIHPVTPPQDHDPKTAVVEPQLAMWDGLLNFLVSPSFLLKVLDQGGIKAVQLPKTG
jgi:hypothetical protein